MKYKLTLIGLLFSFFTVAQSKNQTSVIDVDGVCGMCKLRIEKACFQTKGVKHADWNVETHQLKLIFNNQKTDLDSSNRKEKPKTVQGRMYEPDVVGDDDKKVVAAKPKRRPYKRSKKKTDVVENSEKKRGCCC